MSTARRPRRFGASILCLALVAGLVLVAPTAVGSPSSSSPHQAYIDKKVREAVGLTSALVHVQPQTSLSKGIAIARRAGADVGTRYDAINVFVAYGPSVVFERIAKASIIEAIEANVRLRTFTSTSHKATRGQEVLDGAVTTPAGVTINGAGVGVAVVDSGVDGTHPDLVDRMGGNVKIVCSTPQFAALGPTGGFSQCVGPKTAVPIVDTDTPSGGGHGTHVAGTVAGTGAASDGRFHGAAPGATIFGVSVGTVIAVENGLDGLNWVLENHDVVTPAIKVVNNSWGSSYARYDPVNAPFHKATWKLQEALVAEGVSVVFAAGNAAGNGTTPTTTGECVNPTPGIICVANYSDAEGGTRKGAIDGSSSRGSVTDPMSWPDVSAPGTLITAACRTTLPVCNAHGGAVSDPPNSYATVSGTSMAAPHVSGIVAQLYQANPDLTPAEVEEVLEETAYKFSFGAAYGRCGGLQCADPMNPDDSSSHEKGHGLVDVAAAVSAVLETPTPPLPASPTTFFFHSSKKSGNADLLASIAGATPPTFDNGSPRGDQPAVHIDVPQAGNGNPGAIYDPTWVGRIDVPFTELTLRFWQKQPLREVSGGNVTYRPTLWVGATAVQLPNFQTPASPGEISVVERTFTGLDIDPRGQGIGIAIQPLSASQASPTEALSYGTAIFYDSINFPSGLSVVPKPLPDADSDGVEDGVDNCPSVSNGSQENLDGDSDGDACDADADGDSTPNADDTCPQTFSDGQDDGDSDGQGDACDTDLDNDGHPNVRDNCQRVANPGQEDADEDGVGDACTPPVACTNVSDSQALPETTTYFHRSGDPGSELNEVDSAQGGATFNGTPPSATVPAQSIDAPLISGGNSDMPDRALDPAWTGSFTGSGRIRCLTFDLFQKNYFGEIPFGTADYEVDVIVGSGAGQTIYHLADISETGSSEPITHITARVTEMVGPGGELVPLSIAPGGQPVTIVLRDFWLFGPSTILYDSTDFPSAMIVNEGIQVTP